MRRLIIIILSGIISYYAAAAAPAERADSLYASAVEKNRNGELAGAMDCLFGIIRIAETPDSAIPDELMSRTHLMLGNIYLAYGDNIKAVRHYEAGMALSADKVQNVKFAYNLSLAYCLLGQEKESRHYHRRLLDLGATELPLWQYDIVTSAAFIEKSFGDRARSVALYRRAVFLADSLGLSPQQYAVAPLSEIVEYYDRENDLDSLYYWLTRYEKVADAGLPHIMADCQRSFMQYYIKTGEREKALDYSRRYLLAMDSLVNYNGFLRVSSRQERERETAAAAQIRNLEFTVSKQKFMLFAIVAVLVCLALAWLVAKKMRRNMRQLFARNRELAILEEEMTRGNSVSAGSATVDAEPARAAGAPAGDSAAGQWDELMRQVRRQVSDPRNFCDPDFSINALAALCNSNSRYISQAINETTGDNFRALVNGYRIREARRRLTSDSGFADLTIQSVGESVGFRSASNFINAFKKVTGMTPSLYQRMAKEKGE